MSSTPSEYEYEVANGFLPLKINTVSILHFVDVEILKLFWTQTIPLCILKFVGSSSSSALESKLWVWWMKIRIIKMPCPPNLIQKSSTNWIKSSVALSWNYGIVDRPKIGCSPESLIFHLDQCFSHCKWSKYQYKPKL